MKAFSNYRKANIVMLCLLVVLVVGLIGTTFSFYTSAIGVENMLITKGSEVYLQELFSPDDLWMAGETKTKEVWFGNQSDLDQVIRFKVTINWFDNNGTPDVLTDDTPWMWTGTYNPAPVVLNWTNEITGTPAAWAQYGEYYYYNKVLGKKSGSLPTETPHVLKSVTFSPAISNSAYSGDDFSNKACRITIQMESLDVNNDFTQGAWNMKFTQSGTALAWSPA